jgi:hypothetical protein
MVIVTSPIPIRLVIIPVTIRLRHTYLPNANPQKNIISIATILEIRREVCKSLIIRKGTDIGIVAKKTRRNIRTADL